MKIQLTLRSQLLPTKLKTKMKNLKKILLLISIFSLSISNANSSVFAQVSDEDSTSSSESIKDIMKNADLEKVNGAINNLLNKKVAMIGEVTRITDEAITITNISGTKILPLNNNPRIIKGTQEIGVEKIEVENWVMVLGRQDGDDFSPNFIYVYSESLRPKNQEVIIGTISSITKTELKITTRSNSEERTLKLSKNTTFEDSNGEEARQLDFSEDINVLITGFKDEDSTTINTLRSLAPLSDE